MTVRALYVAGHSYEVTGEGYGPDGKVRSEGTKAEAPHLAPLRELATVLLGCNNAHLVEKDGTWKTVGDPTEGALLVAGAKAGANRKRLEQELPKQYEFPFDSDRKRSTVIRRMPDGKLRAFTNGAPGVLLPALDCESLFKWLANPSLGPRRYALPLAARGAYTMRSSAWQPSLTGKGSPMAYFICVVLSIVFVMLGYAMEGGNLALLLQPAEIVIVSFPSLLMGIAASSGRAFAQSWKLVFTRAEKTDPREVRQVCRFLKVCGTTSMIMGGVATILGFIITMSFMNAPIEVLGEKFGASAVGLLIGMFFKTLCYAAEQRVRGRSLTE